LHTNQNPAQYGAVIFFRDPNAQALVIENRKALEAFGLSPGPEAGIALQNPAETVIDHSELNTEKNLWPY